MTFARIYRPSRTATQSGKANTRHWILEFQPEKPWRQDPLMGWTSSADTRQQVKLRFPSRDDALAFARREGLEPMVIEPKTGRPRLKSYAENFR